jgi:uncharacterized protein
MEVNPSFFDAIKQGNLPAVNAFLADNPALAGAQDENGLSAVLTALYYQQPAVADVLIEHGASLNLFEASASGRLERVRDLLDADPTQVNAWAADGFQPLGLACFFGHTAVVELLLDRGAEVTEPSRNGLHVQPLHSAVAGQHLEIARLLLEHGADANARQGEDFAPLHGAAENGQVEMIRLLLAHGADPHVVNEKGKTPLDYALTSGSSEAADMLR